MSIETEPEGSEVPITVAGEGGSYTKVYRWYGELVTEFHCPEEDGDEPDVIYHTHDEAVKIAYAILEKAEAL